ncbi:DUF4347 domain-containing protein [Thalassospira sp. MCCC 1A01428]|uniref:DUF4347 domain-containing protein n=1 Tax=Thalassospira sp. MCCC 1A01428 TaxID=1470575 RepID=UPI000A1D8A1C|nr:DUF4347 domain-containing protein [Thalassospira sp. MCCC 1A01428]OSQ46442.1 hypothetical protein THS27_01110 [Thalassospira sp. MCCC 1A01428]
MDNGNYSLNQLMRSKVGRLSASVRKAGFGARQGRAGCLVFIDQSLVDIEAIVWRYAGIAEIFMIGASQDGLAVIGNVLSQRTMVQTVHVFGRACDNGMWLGEALLDTPCLRRHPEKFRNWRNGLANDAFFFFHGCAVTDPSFDQVLSASLEAFTGALINVGKDRPQTARSSSPVFLTTDDHADRDGYSSVMSRIERRSGVDRRGEGRRRS